MHDLRRLRKNASIALVLAALVGTASQAEDALRLARVPAETMKPGMAIGTGPALPTVTAVVGAPLPVASCDPVIVAQPLAIGTKEAFSAAGLVMGLGQSALNTGLGIVTGGMVSVGGKRGRGEPELERDKVKRSRKTKVAHPDGHTKLRAGAVLDEDALTMSVYLDKAKGKGTVHAIYLETADCRRFWPEEYQAYALWGQWKMSVSFSATRETYQDGQLIDRTTSSGGWSTGWQRLPGGVHEVSSLTDPDAVQALSDYQVGLLEELGVPAWRRTGFSGPLSGPRSLGARFPVEPAMQEALDAGQLRAVVHVTREVDGLFQTVSMPMQMTPGDDRYAFALLEGSFPGSP